MVLKIVMTAIAVISSLLVGFLLAGMICNVITERFEKHHR